MGLLYLFMKLIPSLLNYSEEQQSWSVTAQYDLYRLFMILIS